MISHIGQNDSIFKYGENTIDAWFTITVMSVIEIEANQNTADICFNHEFFQSVTSFFPRFSRFQPFEVKQPKCKQHIKGRHYEKYGKTVFMHFEIFP